jgi:hypothetical protein
MIGGDALPQSPLVILNAFPQLGTECTPTSELLATLFLGERLSASMIAAGKPPPQTSA